MYEKSYESQANILHLYTFSAPAICLARSQSFNDIINPNGHMVAARGTGGGSMLLDENVLGWTITTGDASYQGRIPVEMFMKPPPEQKDNPKGPFAMHMKFGASIRNALLSYLHRNSLNGIPDVTIGQNFSVRFDGGVIVGNGSNYTEAFDGTKHAGIYHGVLALNKWNVDKIVQMVKISEKEKAVMDRLPYLSKYAKVDIDSLCAELIRYITGEETHASSIPDEMLEKAEELIQEKFSKDSWIKERRDKNGSQYKVDENKGFCFTNLQLTDL